MRFHKSVRASLYLAATATGLLSAQNLPWYLTDQFPSRSAAGVPTNVSILLAIDSSIYNSSPRLSLVSQSGANVQLQAGGNFWQTVAYTPVSQLAPRTRYTFTIQPTNNIADAYSFDFTTGDGPDTSPLLVTNIDPPPGATGIGLYGPITIQFNKPLSTGSVADVIAAPAGTARISPVYRLAPGMERLVVSLSPTANLSKLYHLQVDPTKFIDAFGNQGRGPIQNADYTTFAAVDHQPLSILGTFPGATDANLPLNSVIRVLFNAPLNYGSMQNGVQLLDANGKALNVQLSTFASTFGIQLKPNDLLGANQSYSIQVNSTLTDVDGFPATPATFQFTTGSSVDLTPAQSQGSPPTSVSPQPANVIVMLRASKPIMPLSTIEYSTLGGPPANGTPPVPSRISEDGLTFSVTPPAHGPVIINMVDVVDYAGNSFFDGALVANPGPLPDLQPPTLLAMTPADGSTGVSLYATIGALFDKVLSPALSTDAFRLLQNGQPVAGAIVTLDGAKATLFLRDALQVGGTYVFDINGARDLAGNVAPPISSKFTIAAGQLTGSPKLVSATPGNDDQNVDVNTTIRLTFDSPLEPPFLNSLVTVSDSSFSAYPIDAKVDGGTIIIRPLHALLHDSVIRVSYTVQDLTGRFASGVIAFRTGASSDNSSFQVTSATLAQTNILGGPPVVTVNFSKPANLSKGGISIVANGVSVLGSVQQTNNDQTALLTVYGIAGEITIVIDQRVTDLGGAAIQPFRATFSLSPTGKSDPPRVLGMRPPADSSGVPANTGISLFFSQSVDIATVRAAFFIVADGQPVTGTYEITPDSKTVTFRPDSPFAPGTLVAVLLRNNTLIAGNLQFTIEPAPTPYLSVTGITGGGPANAVFEVEFSAEVSTGQNLAALYANGGQVVPTKESHPRPRVLRLTPLSPLAPGYYSLAASARGGGPYLLANVTAAVNVPDLTVVYGPGDNAVNINTNASIRIASSNKINPLSIAPENFTIQAGGRSIPLLAIQPQSNSQANAGVVITPTEALPPGATVTVSTSGLEDIFGNQIPAKRWQFTTAAGADFNGPVLLETNTPSAVPGATQFSTELEEIPANMPLMYRFDRPLDPLMLYPDAPHRRRLLNSDSA